MPSRPHLAPFVLAFQQARILVQHPGMPAIQTPAAAALSKKGALTPNPASFFDRTPIRIAQLHNRQYKHAGPVMSRGSLLAVAPHWAR